ncbi:MAG: type I-C CRISPR-associated protein Cas8c/Csd1 [Schwartzia sp. (in: firmicutes)]
MLKALVQRYEDECREGNLSREGWEKRKVSFALVLSGEGDVLEVLPLTQRVQRGKKEVEVPQSLAVPVGETRSSGICPFFLCDNGSYFLGADQKGKPKRSADCFAASAKLHQDILADVEEPAAQAVVKFFQTWPGGEAATRSHSALAPYADELLAGGNLVFRYEGRYVHEDRNVRAAWEARLGQEEGEKRRCLVTGTLAPIADKHPAIKGVIGAQSTGTLLVSFNANAYESYGHGGKKGCKTGDNAPVSEKAAFAYGTALNALIADAQHTKRIGDTTVVYWAQQDSDLAQDLFRGMILDDPDGTLMDDTKLNAILHKVQHGEAIPYGEVAIPYDNPFYILGLAPNAARLSVRFFLQGAFGDFLKYVAHHHEQMDIVRPKWETRKHIPLWMLLQETVNSNSRNKMASPVMAGAMLRAVLTGGKYPASVFQNIMLRIRAEQDKNKINARRAGFLKAYLLRNRGRRIEVALNENSTDVAYLLGRWFAVLEEAQENANPDIKATIRDRFFNSACGTPAYVFPMLQKLALHHLKKLEDEEKSRSDILLSEILGKLEAREIPRHLPLEEQGVFILGYYHQKQKRYEKKEEN